MGKKKTLKINNTVLSKGIDSIITKEARRYETIGNQVNKELRKKYTLSWFINDSSTVVDSLEYDVKRITTGNTLRLVFSSWVNIEKYELIKSRKENDGGIYFWCKKAQTEGINMDLSPAEYIVNLQWNKGILGLPYRSVARNTGWKNPHYHKKDLLFKVIQRAYKDHWAQEVNSRYKQKWGVNNAR